MFGLVDVLDFRNVFLDPPGVTGLVSVDSLLLPAPATGVNPPDNGLGGRLAVRIPPLGGCGNAFMLIVFLIVLPAPLTPGVVRNFGRLVLLPPGVEGRLDVEGARRPLLGKAPEAASAFRLAIVGTLPVLFLVFVVGNAGNAVVGGPYEGREAGRGIEAAISNNCLSRFVVRRPGRYIRPKSLPRLSYPDPRP